MPCGGCKKFKRRAVVPIETVEASQTGTRVAARSMETVEASETDHGFSKRSMETATMHHFKRAKAEDTCKKDCKKQIKKCKVFAPAPALFSDC